MRKSIRNVNLKEVIFVVLLVILFLFVINFAIVTIKKSTLIINDNGLIEENLIEPSVSVNEVNEVSSTYVPDEEIVESKIAEAQERIELLDTSNKQEWFKKYKNIQEEYAEYVDTDETIYDYFSEEDLQLLFQIVETEVQGEENFIEKANVASVIFNRLFHEEFPLTLVEVLTEYPQFSSYSTGAYKDITPTDTTILACEYAFQIEDTTNGALWFDSTNGNSWADRNRTYLFTDEVGHSFYK